MSRFCLDPPIVTVLWWILFARYFGESVPWQVGAALGFAVWSIYLLDRLLDSSTVQQTIPMRKQLGPSQIVAMWIFSVASVGAALGFALQMDRHIWMQAGFIGLLTAVYFLLFRKLGKRVRFPAKECLIGFCFAAGVGLPFDSLIDQIKLGGLLIVGTLCVVNCLIISQTEAKYDQESDLSAWFSKSNRSFPFSIVLTITLLATVVLLVLGMPQILGGSLLTSNFLLGLIFFNHRRWGDSIQTICDAALWIPALVGVVLLYFSTS